MIYNKEIHIFLTYDESKKGFGGLAAGIDGTVGTFVSVQFSSWIVLEVFRFRVHV